VSVGAVAAGAPDAVVAGAEILRTGGNAVDAAVAACLAVCVADPANASIGGRCQILVRLRDGRLAAIDGATRAPVPLPARPEPVPLPGLLPALAQVHARFATRPLTSLAAPAVALAREGAVVTPALARIWKRQADRLRSDRAASTFYLRRDGSAPQAGDRMPNPPAASCLLQWSSGGSPPFACAEARAGEIVAAQAGGWQLASAGRQGWGHTLLEILDLVTRLEPKADTAPRRWEAWALAMLSALEDRPQFAGTLAPKPDPVDWSRLLDPDRLDARSRDIAARLDTDAPVADVDFAGVWPGPSGTDRDTTHLSVVDATGNAVALTMSIGPHFGSATADPVHGFLRPHSYRMASAPRAGAVDHTEMTPTIAWHPDGRVVSLGAAGSERIPGAVAKVFWRIASGDADLETAVAAPRLAWHGGRLRLRKDLGAAVIEWFRSRGYDPEITGAAIENHVGIVHGALWHPQGPHRAAADPAYDGAAWVG